MNQILERSWWKSKKLIAYLATLSALIMLVGLQAQGEVAEHVALAVEFSLPVLLGGQAWIDAKVRGTLAGRVNIEEPKS